MSTLASVESEEFAKFSKCKVLVVEDSEVTWRLVERVLKDYGVIEIIWTRDTDDGFRVFCETGPDLVFIDWDMEDNKGFRLARKIKEDGG